MTDPTRTNAIVDGAARVVADAVTGHVFASAVTQSVTDAAPQVVPLDEDFLETDFPVVTVAMGAWDPLLQPGNERLHLTLVGAIWRPRVPLAENTSALYGHRDALADAWIARTKAYLTEATLQSAILMGGPGIVPRSLGDPAAPRMFLTLPFTVEVKCNRSVIPQAA